MGHAAVVGMLLEAGADKEAKDEVRRVRKGGGAKRRGMERVKGGQGKGGGASVGP